ncbi:MAG: type II toxin-antitoxin system RelE/ParE family toxin [Epsilonproteobacteria bacterium]|nr:MAG: type II toxin-antitoxin system RelE/ParE family toxin [Campylobacterota bacterium]
MNSKKYYLISHLTVKNRAILFKKQLDLAIGNLVYFPYKYRQSIHYNDKEVRDLIFKGYTIIYRIDISKDQIAIVDIFKWADR